MGHGQVANHSSPPFHMTSCFSDCSVCGSTGPRVFPPLGFRLMGIHVLPVRPSPKSWLDGLMAFHVILGIQNAVSSKCGLPGSLFMPTPNLSKPMFSVAPFRVRIILCAFTQSLCITSEGGRLETDANIGKPEPEPEPDRRCLTFRVSASTIAFLFPLPKSPGGGATPPACGTAPGTFFVSEHACLRWMHCSHLLPRLFSEKHIRGTAAWHDRVSDFAIIHVVDATSFEMEERLLLKNESRDDVVELFSDPREGTLYAEPHAGTIYEWDLQNNGPEWWIGEE
ncbi:uncharacterized protein LACBIDRAFT_330252 [Laccaria bicolor S238N-H82]|uniref:Predicted protein n=1 Tax=Laccaria bicolor (strain S238N-H82 / ATCC MYA-4686) TaxID=486041 RepID=B0DKP8_LACBS|nr:uncharacterized protein LACBIDRAFT_330252 [Laccaria bicolor S238N-H82]EDR04779.1 predicted protein [Laccaria bicolor S238N-H82]|eukprot:XP_001884603.1 predicted protein [Laccaria bicolor S238N-H82]